jgi:hypothetical protein
MLVNEHRLVSRTYGEGSRLRDTSRLRNRPQMARVERIVHLFADIVSQVSMQAWTSEPHCSRKGATPNRSRSSKISGGVP